MLYCLLKITTKSRKMWLIGSPTATLLNRFTRSHIAEQHFKERLGTQLRLCSQKI
jgi:hypothetical protein